MKTDPSIYEYLSTGAEAFRILSGGVTLNGSYRFVSLTLKGIERRLDCVFHANWTAVPPQTGHLFRRKLDGCSRSNWTVGAKRRAGVMLFTL